MKFSIFFILYTLAFNCFSALINTNQGSFIDDNSGLEWVDFGKTNNMSYNQFLVELNNGGKFEAWRLPTSQEVRDMWSFSIANLYNTADYYIVLPEFDQGVYDSDGTAKVSSSFESLFDIMGYNEFRTSGGDANTAVSLGLYQGATGLAFFEAVDRPYQDGYYGDYLRLTDKPYWSADYYYNSSFPSQSTLLVREVPESSTFSYVALALFFLVCMDRRHTKQVCRDIGNTMPPYLTSSELENRRE